MGQAWKRVGRRACNAVWFLRFGRGRWSVSFCGMAMGELLWLFKSQLRLEVKRRKVVRQIGSGASCLSQTGFSAGALALEGISWGVGHGRREIREDDGAQAFEFDDNKVWLHLYPGELWWNIHRSWRPCSASARSPGLTYSAHRLLQAFVSIDPGVAPGGTYTDNAIGRLGVHVWNANAFQSGECEASKAFSHAHKSRSPPKACA